MAKSNTKSEVAPSANITPARPCNCGSGLSYSSCCGPLLAGEEKAASAEALMRSRYTAYCELNNDYLLSTWHPATRPEEAPADADTLWLGLDILNCQGGAPSDADGEVEFNARCQVNGQPGQLHEVSRFRFEQDQWWYVDGAAPGPVRNPGKIGRNDLCPCGSGRKYKRCCGA